MTPIDAAAPTVGAAASKVPTGVPPFAKTAGVDPDEVRERIRRSQGSLDNGDDEALALAMAAVKADPGSGVARAILAEVVGDEAFSLAQLTPLTTAADCADCADALRNLRLGKWPASVAALAAKARPSPTRLAAESLTGFLDDGDATKVAALFRGEIDYVSLCSVCDGNEGDIKKRVAGPELLAELSNQIATAEAEGMSPFVAGGPMYCTGDCCAEPTGSLMHSHVFFDTVCFVPGTTQIKSLTFVDGG